MPKNPAVAALLRDLASSHMDQRVAALTKLETSGTEFVADLAGYLASDQGSEQQRTWAAVALCRTGDDERKNARSAAAIALSSRSASVRRAAVELLGTLGDPSSIDLIVAHLDDDEVATGGMFEDERSVAEVARATLRAMNTEASLAALANADDNP